MILLNGNPATGRRVLMKGAIGKAVTAARKKNHPEKIEEQGEDYQYVASKMRFLELKGWKKAGGDPYDLDLAKVQRYTEIIKVLEKNKDLIEVIDGDQLMNIDFNKGEKVCGYGIDTYLITSDGKLAIVSN